MPKLIVQRPKKRRKAPPCGRIINYVEPRSPFQRLIDGRRREKGISGRELAKLLTAAGAKVSQSSLWIWLHNENGYPHPKAFKNEHLKALARVLELSEKEITKAIDASRVFYQPKQEPTPAPVMDAFATFIRILENDRRTNVSLGFVVNLAKNLYNGALAHQQAT